MTAQFRELDVFQQGNQHAPAVGEFRSSESDKLFYYAKDVTKEFYQFPIELRMMYPDVVEVSPDPKHKMFKNRAAKILKTVAYIVVDEDDTGKYIVEKWKIKQHKTFAR